MKLVTFKGGIHPPYNKELTNQSRIIPVNQPEKVYIPLLQHIGAPCDSLVKKGDSVKVGQKIGDSGAFVSSPVHSSVSGTVAEIKKYIHPSGTMVNTVVIENDGKNTLYEGLKKGDYKDMSPEEIINAVHEAGIVGMGGAGFPMHIKLSPPKDKVIEYLVVNGAECEPYLSTDHRTMIEHTEKIIYGIKAIMKATGAKKSIIAIEDNKHDAENALSELIKNEENIEISVMETKYPQGSEKHIIKSVLNREVPSGGLPADVGVIVNNIDTCVAVANAIREGMPVIKKRITVSGGGANYPGVFETIIGTPFSVLIEAAGGFSQNTKKVVMGGPMMGMAQFDMNAPVIKTTSGLIALTRSEMRPFEEGPCLRCGKCVEACPMNLMPLMLLKSAKTNNEKLALEYNVKDCLECGSCSFICPANRPIVENIRILKSRASIKTAQGK